MIGKRTAARNLDQRCEKHARRVTGGANRRLSMPLDGALADIEFGITEMRIKKTL
jgi:hypothetical protein